MGGKSQPDYGEIAAAEGEYGQQMVRDQLYANRPTQYTPWGYTNWTTETMPDGTERWTQTSGLTPELQDILNKQIAIQGGRTDIAGMLTGRMGQEFGQQMDWSGLSPMGQVPTAQYTLPEGGIDDPYQTRQRAEQAVYSQAMSRLQPSQDSERAQLEQKLLNQGLNPADAQYKSQMQALNQKHSDQQNQALWSANQAGLAESGQMFGQQLGLNQNRFNQALGANAQNWQQSLQGSQYANQIRQQQLTEAMQKRGFSLNEINALLSGQQVGMPSMPDFSQGGVAQTPDFVGAAAQGASDANAANPWNALIGAGSNILGSYLGRPTG